MLRAIIADDEIESIRGLMIKLAEGNTPVEVVHYTTDPLKVSGLLAQYAIDVLFLDVEMPGLNGLDLLESLKERNFEVVLVTAYDDYAMRAIKASAIDYLLKPVDVQELETALRKIKTRRLQDLPQTDALHQLAVLLEHAKPSQSILALNSFSETFYVATIDIVFISGENNYSTFHLTSNKTIVVSRTIKEFEIQLSDKAFFRVHKSYLVNLHHVRQMKKGVDLAVIMTDGKRIEVSFRKRADFQRAMNEFIG